jgi:hypothetical protein
MNGVWCSQAAARILLKWEERMYPGYQPKPDDVFHAVGYTTRGISDNTHFRLHGISDRVRVENENLWRQLGPLVRAMQSGKVMREFVEVLSVDPFLGITKCPTQGRIWRCSCLLST